MKIPFCPPGFYNKSVDQSENFEITMVKDIPIFVIKEADNL